MRGDVRGATSSNVSLLCRIGLCAFSALLPCCVSPDVRPDAGDVWRAVAIDPPAGQFGARCVSNAECRSGLCLARSGRCTTPCASCDDCPRGDDWSCGASVCVCTPQFDGVESCGNRVDDDCDGLADEGCTPEGTDPQRPVTDDCDGGCAPGFVCRTGRCRC